MLFLFSLFIFHGDFSELRGQAFIWYSESRHRSLSLSHCNSLTRMHNCAKCSFLLHKVEVNFVFVAEIQVNANERHVSIDFIELTWRILSYGNSFRCFVTSSSLLISLSWCRTNLKVEKKAERKNRRRAIIINTMWPKTEVVLSRTL